MKYTNVKAEKTFSLKIGLLGSRGFYGRMMSPIGLFPPESWRSVLVDDKGESRNKEEGWGEGCPERALGVGMLSRSWGSLKEDP